MERETGVARKRVHDAETAIIQDINDMSTAENVGATTRTPKLMFGEILNAVRDSLSDLSSSEDEEDGQDEDNDYEDTGLGKLREDDEPGWVMGTFPNQVPRCMESLRQKQMRRDELMLAGCGDAMGGNHGSGDRAQSLL